MTVLKPYTDYQDSGVEWLGDVPEHWRISRLKQFAQLNPSKSEIPASDGNDLVTFLPMEKVSTSGRVDNSLSRPMAEVQNGLTYFRDNDVIVAKITPCFENGKSAIVTGLTSGVGFGSTEFHVLRASQQLDNQFLYRIVSSHNFLALGEESMQGAGGQKRVPSDFILNFLTALPLLDEQRAIADFLDGMDGRITRFIAARRKMITLLEEQKQAVINQAVTRGLDPDVPMKDSGVDWLGEIPAHWGIATLRQTCGITGGMTPTKSHPDYWQGDVPWVSPKDMKQFRIADAIDHISQNAVLNTGLSILPVGSVLLVVRGMILARKIPIGISDSPITINQDMKALLPGPRLEPEYLAWILTAGQQALFPLIDEAGHGTRRLPTPSLLGVSIPTPMVEEQLAIINHIDRETSRIDALISRHWREVNLMQEYRTRLISDAVTGKLDVRGVELPPVEVVVGEEIEAVMEEEPVSS